MKINLSALSKKQKILIIATSIIFLILSILLYKWHKKRKDAEIMSFFG